MASHIQLNMRDLQEWLLQPVNGWGLVSYYSPLSPRVHTDSPDSSHIYTYRHRQCTSLHKMKLLCSINREFAEDKTYCLRVISCGVVTSVVSPHANHNLMPYFTVWRCPFYINGYSELVILVVGNWHPCEHPFALDEGISLNRKWTQTMST